MVNKVASVCLQMSLVLAVMATACLPTGCVAQTKKGKNDGFVQIFDGKTLNGWEGDPTYWRVENGNLVGEITPSTLLKTNSFIIWQGGEPADFEFKGEFNITEAGNSGINYRSDRLTDVPFALRGYQADIDGRIRYTGQNYEERKRTTLAYRGQKTTIPAYTGASTPEAVRANVKNNAWGGLTVTGSLGSSDSLKTFIKSEDWNTFHLIVKGNHLQHYINGVLMSEVIDNDAVNGMKKGLLGVQVHVGPPMKVQYRKLMLKQL
ncbi:3-keto-disaccharide hydrolase [Spirosoma areae]